ncbi:Rieske Fe-S protein [Haloactinopolyspora alba]|uniref:Cytochrome bc1 complex Rieske iron-sulfur subunit n=1 Tax=Haloactinopolyspora alba TaxID=648780 RepID=A0A2P8E3K5_9ACTN|nr:Rieske (2Fe-2S) protein [Haloactinopolyspora alba]PSL04055.1 Rieske Fe-S protein [Haloactinopolyspora alba]
MGAGAVGVAGVLAACGGEDAGDGTAGETPGTPSGGSTGRTQPDSSTGDTSTESSTGGGGTGGNDGQLTTTEEVPVGGGVILDGASVVVTQPTAGEFVAFSSICTHQGCAVTEVSDGVIRCPCHGSEFSATDGSVVRQPAPEPLPEVPITVEGGRIVRG